MEAVSAYGNEARPVRIGQQIIGFYLKRGYEPECGVLGCPAWGTILGYFFTRKEAIECARAHYRARHM